MPLTFSSYKYYIKSQVIIPIWKSFLHQVKTKTNSSIFFCIAEPFLDITTSLAISKLTDGYSLLGELIEM
jgi:hypothetical protein